MRNNSSKLVCLLVKFDSRKKLTAEPKLQCNWYPQSSTSVLKIKPKKNRGEVLEGWFLHYKQTVMQILEGGKDKDIGATLCRSTKSFDYSLLMLPSLPASESTNVCRMSKDPMSIKML